MTPLIKSFLALLLVFVVGGFYKFVPGLLPLHQTDVDLPHIIIAAVMGAILGLGIAARHTLALSFLNKPLWGFRITNQGYYDISVQKHPYLSLSLVSIVLLFGVLSIIVSYKLGLFIFILPIVIFLYFWWQIFWIILKEEVFQNRQKNR